MTGRRRRTGDEFADERSPAAGEDPGRYGPPGGREPPWSPAEEPGDPWSSAQQTGPQWPPGQGPDAAASSPGRSRQPQGQEADRSARRGRHSASPPPGAPYDSYPAAGAPRPRSPEPRPRSPEPRPRSPEPGPRSPEPRRDDLPPWQDLPWQDSSPRVPRQQPPAGQVPPPQAPSRRAAGRPGPSLRPGEDSQPSVPYGAPTGRYPVPPGGAVPPAGDRYGRGDALGGPTDSYGASDARGRDERGRGFDDGSGYPGAEQGDRGDRGAGDSYRGTRGQPPRRRQQGPPGDYSPEPDGYPGTGRRPAGGYAPGDGTPRGSRYGAREADRDDDYDGFFAPSDRGSRAGGGGGSGGYDDGGDRPARPKRRRRGRYAALIAVLVIVLPLCVGAYFVYKVIAGHFFPADYSGPGTGSVVVQVRPGDTATVVGDRLYTMGVVASARAFVLAAEASPNASGLQPGFYRMHEHMNATLAFALLLKPSSRVQLTVTIPEGLRATQIVATLAHGSGIPLADYQQALRHASTLGLPSYARGNPEGYLFPATYTIQPGMTATSVLQAMVKSFDNEAAGVSLTQAAAHVHLSPAQVIVVASLAQAEGGKLSDFPKIAEVIYNRLAAGMPLQFDSTVMYALHTYGIRASSSQLQANSPYNTYRHKGLPPGPIDSPGDAAIRAALHPASGNWLYFVTVNPKTRQTDFTSSYAVFQRLQAQSQGG